MKRMGVRDSGAQSGGAMLSGAAQGEARLLVVEDDPNILELLSASLRFAGFSVRTATDGLRSLILLEDQLGQSASGAASAGLQPKARSRGVGFIEFAIAEARTGDLGEATSR